MQTCPESVTENRFVVGEIVGEYAHGQTFTASSQGLTGLRVWVATFGRPAAGRLLFRLFSGTSENDLLLWETRVEAASLKDNEWLELVFDPIPESRGRCFHLAVSSPLAIAGAAATLWANDDVRRPGAFRTLMGFRVPGSLCFQALYA